MRITPRIRSPLTITVESGRRPAMLRTFPVKPLLFALLGINAITYTVIGRSTEMLDAAAWFALLVLFELETRWPDWTQRRHNAIVLQFLRIAAAVAIFWTAITFLHEREWLDAVNAWLWIGVVAVLELEVRAPVWVARHGKMTGRLSVALYSALALLAVAWFINGEWFDGYDAVLWISAFALLEMELLQPHRHKQPSLAINRK
jgi:hypothetical protein